MRRYKATGIVFYFLSTKTTDWGSRGAQFRDFQITFSDLNFKSAGARYDLNQEIPISPLAQVTLPTFLPLGIGPGQYDGLPSSRTSFAQESP